MDGKITFNIHILNVAINITDTLMPIGFRNKIAKLPFMPISNKENTGRTDCEIKIILKTENSRMLLPSYPKIL